MNELWPWLTLALLGAYHGLNPGMGWLFAVALGLQERSRAAVFRAFVPIALGHAASIALIIAVVGAAQAFVAPAVVRTVGAVALMVFGLYKLLAPMSHPRWVGMRVNFRDLTVWSFLMATAHGAGLMLAPVLLHLTADAAPPAVYAAPPVAVVQATSTAASDNSSYCSPSYDHTRTMTHVDHADHTQPAGASNADHAAQHAHYHTSQPAAPASSLPAEHADHAQHLAQVIGSGPPLAEIGAVGVHTSAMFVVMAVIAVVVFEKFGLAILRQAWFNLDRMWAIALIGAGALTFLM